MRWDGQSSDDYIQTRGGPFNGKQAAKTATGIAGGMTVYLRGIREKLYALFGTGYLDSTAAPRDQSFLIGLHLCEHVVT